MTAIEQQILTDYETNGTSPALISKELSVDLVAVQAILFRLSSKFRDSVQTKQEEDISDADFNMLREVLKNLAINSDSDNVRAKVAMFLFNEKKGRNNSKANIINRTNINLLSLNEGLLKAREALAQGNVETLKQIEAKILDIKDEQPKT